MRTDKKHPQKADKNTPSRVQKRGIVGYSKKSALLEEAITHMNTGKYGQSSAALKDLLSLDPHNTEARRLFATLHLRLGSLATARQAFESLTNEAIERQDFWLAESLLREYLAAGPRCVPFLELLAHVYEEKGDALAAVAELGKAIGILIEGSDSENPKKPSQLYAKVRELAPASSEAFQFASLFDIQTGELLVPHPLAPAAGTSLEIDASQPQDKILPSTEESRASDVMPWEQFGGAPLLGSGSVLDPSATTQPESVSDHLASPAPAPDLTEPSDSILAEGPSTSPAVLPEPEVPSPSAADSSSTVPFSWNTVFDGALKFATGTLSSSSPAAVSKPDATSQDAKDLESVQQESVPDSELSAPSIPSTPEPPVSFSDPEPLPSAHPSILSEVGELIAETDTIREPDLPQPTEILLSEEPLRPEEPPTLSSAIPNSLTVDLPVPPLSEPVEPAREAEPVSFPSLMEPQPVAPLLEVSAPESSCSTVISEAPPAPEPVSTEHHETPITLHQTAEAPPLSAASSNAPSASPASMDTLSHRSTGEVGVQSHRPSEKKRKWDKKKGKAPVVPPTPLPLVEEPSDVVAELSRSGGWESAPSESLAPVVEAVAHVVEKDVLREDTRPEWVRASESITFVNPSPSSSATWQDPGIESTHSKPEPAPSVAASAVDVLFDSTGAKSQVRTQDRLASRRPRPRFAARVARVRIGISSFIGSCFSTTRSIALLCLGLAFFGVALVAVGIGAVGLVWMAMEASPSPVYHNLTPSPPQALTDSRKNGYFLLLGFDASAEQDPLQAGYERKVDGSALQVASACMLGDERKETTTGAPDNVIRGWFTSADPVAQLKPQAAAVRSWAAQESLALRRYQQWLSMPFEDVGYGQILSPNCTHILLAHRLYLAEGFAQDLSTGLGRLETDMGSWRAVLGQSRTLMVKMLAATAVQDDVAIVSGLFTRQDLDGTAIGRLGKIVRPFDQIELSLQWPMQSHLAWATKATTTSLKNDKTNERPLYVALVAKMPLPVQQRSNAYADYYEAASKAVAEGRYTNLPKPSSFIRTPAVSVVDYVANPIEHIIGIEPLPSWDPYVGRMVETDARLRLASLQGWMRRGAQEGDVFTRLAKAGQAHYDPFTGLPMMVDQRKGVMYSVGQDGKDQEGDPLRDVVATIPMTQSVVPESRRSVSPPRSR